MGLLAQAQEDIKTITTNLHDWATDITFIDASLTFDQSFDPSFGPDKVCTIQGLHTKRRSTIDGEGNEANVKHAHISFSESVLVDAGFTVRLAVTNEVYLKRVKVRVKDSTGVECKYVIREWFPDETIGLIVCILGDFDEA